MTNQTREEYLTAAAEWLLDDLIIPETNQDKPPYRVSTGWPRGVRGGRKHRILGACHSRDQSADGHNEIFISPTIGESKLAIGTLLHELIHAVDDCKSGHRGMFAKMAHQCGFIGRMTEINLSEELDEALDWYVTEYGEMPHAPLDDSKRKKQTTRMIKVTCSQCDFNMRTSARHIANMKPGSRCLMKYGNSSCKGHLIPAIKFARLNEETSTMYATAPKAFTKMTMKQKQQTRAHLRSNGIDPMTLSPREFVDYAKKHGFLKTAEQEDIQNTGPAEIETDTTPENEPTETETFMVPDDEDEPADDEDEPADDEDEPADDEDELADNEDEPADDEDEQAPPEMSPPENPMDQMIDDRVRQHIERHIYADEHRLSSRQTRKLIDKAVKRAVSRLKPAAPAATVIKVANRKPKKIEGPIHAMFESALKIATDPSLHLYMKGDAGSGKTHIAGQIAAALDLQFYMVGKVEDVFTLTGYKNAAGEFVETDFYKCFVNGGVILLDEYDRYVTEAMICANAGMSNNMMAFPNGLQQKHADCIILAAGNTYGTGHDRIYTAAQALDGSSLNRLTKIEIGYDETLERDLALANNNKADKWVDFVQKARANACRAKLDIIISPRDSINGAKLLAKGFSMTAVKSMTFMAGISKDVKAVLEA